MIIIFIIVEINYFNLGAQSVQRAMLQNNCNRSDPGGIFSELQQIISI